LVTLITTGTFAPVRVAPQDVPVDPAAGAEEHAARQTSPQPTTVTAATQRRAVRFAVNCRIFPVAVRVRTQ
jgi:hypothetical protein